MIASYVANVAIELPHYNYMYLGMCALFSHMATMHTAAAVLN